MAGLTFDVAYTSLLTRAHQTLDIIKREIGQPDLKTVEHWRLNERHYGDLTGYNKEEMADKYGLEQVSNYWRRLKHIKDILYGLELYLSNILDIYTWVLLVIQVLGLKLYF